MSGSPFSASSESAKREPVRLSREQFLEAMQSRFGLSPEIWALLGLDVEECNCGWAYCPGWVVKVPRGRLR